jgi:hypothetical protein
MYKFIILLALFGSAANASEPASAPPVCAKEGDYNKLGVDAFDQDMNGGWRKLANIPGCETVAADVIRDYRQYLDGRMSILFWHEAQLRALGGSNGEAIKLMRKSLKTDDYFGWNEYVDASIAFLKNDKRALLKARKRLETVPEPTGRNCVDGDGKKISCGDWPPNLDVVDALVACFGKSYQQAYSESDCRARSKR